MSDQPIQPIQPITINVDADEGPNRYERHHTESHRQLGSQGVRLPLNRLERGVVAGSVAFNVGLGAPHLFAFLPPQGQVLFGISLLLAGVLGWCWQLYRQENRPTAIACLAAFVSGAVMTTLMTFV